MKAHQITKFIIVFLVATVVALVLHSPANALNFGGTTNNFRTFSQAHANANALGVGVGIGGGGGYGGGGIGYINTPRNAPMAYAPPAYPTATCLKAYSGGGSGLTFGFSAGVTVVDTECRIFEGMRAIVNAANNGFLTKVVGGESVADRMLMDIMCDAETTETTRDCKTHLAMREAEDNPQPETPPTDDPLPAAEADGITITAEPEVKRAKLQDLIPFWD